MVHEEAAAFALDALDADESLAFEEHLRGCTPCQDGLEPLRLAAVALAFAGELPRPRAELRVRVLDVGGALIPLRRRFRGQLLSAVAVAAACLAVVTLLQPWHEDGAEATLLVGATGHAVLVVRNLPTAPAGRAYEAWVIDGRHVLPAGILHGSMTPLTRRVPAGATVLISLEPAGGSLRPTGPLVLRAETT